MATDGYDSYAMFIYLDDGLQWVQAQLKPQVPEVAAQAGFDSGTQTYAPVILPGSGLPEAKDWNRLVIQASLSANKNFHSLLMKIFTPSCLRNRNPKCEKL